MLAFLISLLANSQGTRLTAASGRCFQVSLLKIQKSSRDPHLTVVPSIYSIHR